MGSNRDTRDSLYVTEDASPLAPNSNTVYYVGSNQMNVIYEKRGDESNGSNKVYNINFISEELIGNIKVSYDFSRNSVLSDGAVILPSNFYNAPYLVSINGGNIIDGVRGKAFQFNGISQYFKQQSLFDSAILSQAQTPATVTIADSNDYTQASG